MKRLITCLFLVCATPAFAQDPAPEPIVEGDILPYLEQVITLQRAVADTELLPDNAREILLKDRLRLNAKKLLEKSFAFTRAQTALFSAAPTPDQPAPEQAESRRSKLLKAATDADQRVADVEAKLAARGVKAITREKLQGDLKLAKAQQELLQTMIGIFNTEGDNSGSLIDQINALAHTTMDESSDQSAASKEAVLAKAPVTTPAEKTVEEGDGMLKLSTNLFSFSRKKNEIDNLAKQAKALGEKNRELSLSIRTALRAALAEGTALSAQNTNDAKSLGEYRKSLSALITRYKQLSTTIIPIGEMNVTLETMDRNLQEWSRLIQDDWNRVFRQLLLRLIILSVAIAIPLFFSSIAHRTIVRYVKDPKRQKQLNIVRRIILVTVLAFVILANFITEFGSLATFAGFITAGLAVALQTVLVSLVAHFFFFGRFGVRAGDRITVSGVTGDVVQVGMLRLYLREFEETENGLRPSGKIVAFPNSILFQPTAFYKHMDEFK